MPSENNPRQQYVEMEFDADNPSGVIQAPDGTIKTRKEIYATASEGTEILDDFNASHLLDEFEAFDLIYDVSKTEALELRQIPYVILHGGFHEPQNDKLRSDIAHLPAEKFNAVFAMSDMTPAEIRALPLAFKQAGFPENVLNKIKTELKILHDSDEQFVMNTVFDFANMSEGEQADIPELQKSGMLPRLLNAQLSGKIEDLAIRAELADYDIDAMDDDVKTALPVLVAKGFVSKEIILRIKTDKAVAGIVDEIDKLLEEEA